MAYSLASKLALVAGALSVVLFRSQAARAERLRRKQVAEEKAKVAALENSLRDALNERRAGADSMTGKLVVVTGASSGIGLAIAKAFHRSGAFVCVAARRMDRLRALCSELDATESAGKKTSRAFPVRTDVTDRASVGRLVAQAEGRFSTGVDVLVNNAGVMYFTMMKNCQEHEWEQTVDVNCKGVLHGFGAVLPGMVKRGKGHIITISSDAGRRVFPTLAVYCASKYFVEALSEGTRRELKGTGVRVTTIQPGDCATDLVRQNTDTEALESMGVKAGAVVGEGWADEWSLLQPKDVADAVLYAATTPPHVAINEILIEPRDQA